MRRLRTARFVERLSAVRRPFLVAVRVANEGDVNAVHLL